MRQNFTFCKPWAKCNYPELGYMISCIINNSKAQIKWNCQQVCWHVTDFLQGGPLMISTFSYKVLPTFMDDDSFFVCHFCHTGLNTVISREIFLGVICLNVWTLPLGCSYRNTSALKRKPACLYKNHNMGLTLNVLLWLAPLSHSCVLVWICVAFSAPFWNSQSPRLSGTPQVKVMGRF